MPAVAPGHVYVEVGRRPRLRLAPWADGGPTIHEWLTYGRIDSWSRTHLLAEQRGARRRARRFDLLARRCNRRGTLVVFTALSVLSVVGWG